MLLRQTFFGLETFDDRASAIATQEMLQNLKYVLELHSHLLLNAFHTIMEF